MPGPGWPPDWSERIRGQGCLLCASVGIAENHVIDLPFSEVRLEPRSRLHGYCIVVWRHGHVAEPTELGTDQAAGYWRDVLDVGRAIQARFQPMKLNFLTLGNWVPHLHTHVLPRYIDDPAPGGPIAWEAIFSDKPIDPDVLKEQAATLRALLGGLPPG